MVSIMNVVISCITYEPHVVFCYVVVMPTLYGRQMFCTGPNAFIYLDRMARVITFYAVYYMSFNNETALVVLTATL